MMSALTGPQPISPTFHESELAQSCSRLFARFTRADLSVSISDSGETTILPAAAVRLLVDLLSAMAEGNAVTVIPIHAELTTQQAADLLGVSRPFLIKQINEDQIPHHMIGTHRRVYFKDLMDFKQRHQNAAEQALADLAAEGQAIGEGY